MSSAWPWIWTGLGIGAVAVFVLIGRSLWLKAKLLARRLERAGETFGAIAERAEERGGLEPLPANALARSRAEVREEYRRNRYQRLARRDQRRQRDHQAAARLADIAGLGSLGPVRPSKPHVPKLPRTEGQA